MRKKHVCNHLKMLICCMWYIKMPTDTTHLLYSITDGLFRLSYTRNIIWRLHVNVTQRLISLRFCRCRSGRNTWATTGTLSFSRRSSSRFRSISRHSTKIFSTPSITTRTSKASLSRGWRILTTMRRKHRSSRKGRSRRCKMSSAQQTCPYSPGDMIHLPKTDVRVHT